MLSVRAESRTAIIAIIITLLTLSQKLFSQEELGYINSNYAGVNGLFLNPSANVDSKIFIDAHIVGLNAFVHSNVLFFPKSDFSPIAGTVGDPLVDETDERKRGFTNMELIGPSVAVSWDKHAFGLFTRLRTFTDADMTKTLFVLALKDFNYTPYFKQSFKESASINNITWFETGISYGYMQTISNFETLNWGINIKRLTGINATSVAISNLDFLYNKKKNFGINTFEGSYRIVEPAWGIGTGWGIDLGVNYQVKLDGIVGYRPNTKAGGCKHIEYKYKLGLSLIDIGWFSVDGNAVVQEYKYTGQPFNFDTSKAQSPEDIDKLIVNNLNNNQITQARTNNFTATLPFAISAQFDYNFENFFYLNVTTITGFKLPNQATRIDILSVTPRYERKYFEVSAPLSLIDYRYIQLGLALRFGNNLIIGTNRLDSFLGGIRDVYGGDIYFNLKFAFYRKCGGMNASKVAKNTRCNAYD